MSGHWQECTGVQILDCGWKRNDLSCLTRSSQHQEMAGTQMTSKKITSYCRHLQTDGGLNHHNFEKSVIWEGWHLSWTLTHQKASLHNKRCLCSSSLLVYSALKVADRMGEMYPHLDSERHFSSTQLVKITRRDR